MRQTHALLRSGSAGERHDQHVTHQHAGERRLSDPDLTRDPRDVLAHRELRGCSLSQLLSESVAG